MAQLVLGVAGAAVGSMFGAPQLGWELGVLVGSAFASGQKTEGPRLSDLRVTGTAYGSVIPWVAGSPRISGQIVWASKKREISHSQGGGKGGGPEVTTYTYEVDVAIMLTENAIAGVARIWSNGTLVYGSGTTQTGVWNGLKVYTGSTTQLPDPTYEAAVGVGNAPAFRGRSYVVIQGLQLGSSGQLPNLTFEIGFSDSAIKYLITNTNTLVDSSIFNAPITTYGGASWGSTSESRVPYALTCPATTSAQQPAMAQWGNGWSGVPDASVSYQYTGDYTQEFSFKVTSADPGAYSGVWVDLFASGGNTLSFGYSASSSSLTVWYQFGSTGGTLDANYYVKTSLGSGITWSVLQGWCHAIFVRSGSNCALWIVSLATGSVYKLNWPITGNGAPLTFNPSLQPENRIGLHSCTSATTRPSSYNSAGVQIGNVRFAYKAMYDPTAAGPTLTLPLSGGLMSGSEAALSLQSTAGALLTRAGYAAGDFDVSALSGIAKPVHAYAISQLSNTRTSLELLQNAYFFETAKSDKLYLRPRATSTTFAIPFSDLAASQNEISTDEPLAIKMASDLELPSQVVVSYADMTLDYNANAQSSSRLLVGQASVQQMQMPLGLFPEEAKGIADSLMLDLFLGSTTISISVPLKYAYIEPGDVGTVTNYDGRTYRVRVKQRTDNLTYLQFDCVLDSPETIAGASTVTTGYVPTASVVQILATTCVPLDLPILRDSDNSPGWYAAISRAAGSGKWYGAQLFDSFDGTTYASEATYSDETVIGTASNTLGNWAGGPAMDYINTLTVTVNSGTLSSTTRTAMLNDQSVNLMVVGSEVIQYLNATLVSTGVYTLSGLLRGRRGTEWAISGHGASETCVKLQADGMRRVTTDLARIGAQRHVKGVSNQTTVSSATDQLFTDTGIALKPFSVTALRSAPSGSDLSLTWIRRTRMSCLYGGSIGVSTPLGEESERYRVRIFSGATLKRTDYATSNAYTYTVANIAADGFTSGNSITFEVCQMSASVGAGYPTTAIGKAP